MADQQPAPGALWTDERIQSYAWNAPDAWQARRISGAMKRVRDEYQAALDAAHSALAEREAEVAQLRAALNSPEPVQPSGECWQPIVLTGDNRHYETIREHLAAVVLEYYMTGAKGDVALCRRVAQPTANGQGDA